jgi:hypothetical protein
MARVITLGLDFRGSLEQAGIVHGSPAARAVGRVIRELAEAEHLPGPDDGHGIAPGLAAVSKWAYARLVPRTGGFWLWYQADDTTIILLAVARAAG